MHLVCRGHGNGLLGTVLLATGGQRQQACGC